MLSRTELNALIRDERAWRRGLLRGDEGVRDVSIPLGLARAAPRALLRRGTADNAVTLRFLSHLRSSSPVEGCRCGRALSPAPAWSRSTRVAVTNADDVDILRGVLRRNAKRSSPTSSRPAASVPRTGRASAEAVQLSPHPVLLQERLAGREHAERERLILQEGRRRANLRLTFAQCCSEQLAAEEYAQRRALFREAMCEKEAILEAESAAFERATGMSHVTFVKLHALQIRERLRRRVLERNTEHGHTVIRQLANLDGVRIVDAELLRCARREQKLLTNLAAVAGRMQHV